MPSRAALLFWARQSTRLHGARIMMLGRIFLKSENTKRHLFKRPRLGPVEESGEGRCCRSPARGSCLVAGVDSGRAKAVAYHSRVASARGCSGKGSITPFSKCGAPFHCADSVSSVAPAPPRSPAPHPRPDVLAGGVEQAFGELRDGSTKTKRNADSASKGIKTPPAIPVRNTAPTRTWIRNRPGWQAVRGTIARFSV